MGIKDLIKFINMNYPDAIEYVKFNDCKNKIIAIDSNLHFIRFWSVHCSNYINSQIFKYSEDNLKDQVEFEVIFIHTMKSILWSIITFLNYSITPIFVFDGGIQEEKFKTCEKRKKIREKTKEKIKPIELIDDDTEKKIKSWLKNICHPTREYIDKCRKIISLLGIPTLLSKTDSEKLCCSLYIEGKVNAVYSGDSDCIPFRSYDFYYRLNL